MDKKTVEHLANLSRVHLSSKEEEKIAKDLEKIIDYFEDLKDVNTHDVEPVVGGTSLKNIWREDVIETLDESSEIKKQFPEKEDEFLKVPKIF